MLYDMIKSGSVSGSRVMLIIANNLESETAEDILQEVLSSIVPAIVAKYLPMNSYDSTQSRMFNTCRRILESGRFTVESTQ